MEDETMTKFTVYLITCLPTGLEYVGSTSRTLPQRWGVHRHAALKLHKTSPLAAAIRTFGPKAFERRVLLVVHDQEIADVRERAFIKYRKTIWPDGLNSASGGHCGFNVHPAQAAKLSAAKTGERHPAAKLTDEQALQIRELYAVGGVTQAGLGGQLGVSPAIVHNIVRGKTWKHLSSMETAA
jgi:hypothetical protein